MTYTDFMLKFRKVIAWITMIVFLLPQITFAAAIPLDLKFQILSQGRVRDLADYIGLIFQYAVGVAGIFAVALIMWGGMKWIFSGGDQGAVKSAQETIRNAVIGLILALGAYLLLNTINPNLVALQVPALRNISPISGTSTGFCPNTNDFAGKFPCGHIYNLKDGTAPRDLTTFMQTINPQLPSCWGASCGEGEGGCWHSTQIQATPERAPFRCLDANQCGTKCEDITVQAVCDSDACTQKMGQRCWWGHGDAGCKPRIATGEACDAGAHLPSCPAGARCGDLTCADPNATCNGATAPDKCVKNGTLEKGSDCDRGSQCKSGSCDAPNGAATNIVASAAVGWGASKVGAIVGGIAGGIVGCVGGIITGPGVILTCAGGISGGVALGSTLGSAAGVATGAGYYVYQTVRDGKCN